MSSCMILSVWGRQKGAWGEGWKGLGCPGLVFGPKSEGKEKLVAVSDLSFCEWDWAEIDIWDIKAQHVWVVRPQAEFGQNPVDA